MKRELALFSFILVILFFLVVLKDWVEKDTFLPFLIFFHFSHFLYLFIFFFAFFGLGYPFIRKVSFQNLGEKILFSFSLGAGIFSIIILLLGVLGVIQKFSLAVLLLVSAGAGIFFFAREKVVFNIPSYFIPLVLFLFWTYLLTLTPPLSYDALSYHLALPKLYLSKGKITYVPYHLYSNLPFNMEMQYLVALTLFDDYTAKGLHFLMGIMLGWGVYLWGRRWKGEKGGYLSLLFFLLIPLFFQLSSLAYNDLLLSLYVFLFLYSLIFRKDREAYIFSALFAGLSLGTKYTGLLYTLPFLFGYLLIKERKPAPLLTLSFFLLPSLPWLLKNLFFTGNPFYPLFYNFLDGKDYSIALYQKFVSAHRATPTTLVGFFISSFNILKDYRFGYHFLFLTPLFFSKKRALLLTYSLYFLFMWYIFTHRDSRFAFPLFPLLSVAAGVSILEFKERLPLISSFFLLIGVLFSLGSNLYRDMLYFTYYDFGKVALRLEERDKYLEEKLYFYPAMEFINQNLPRNSKILFVGDNQTYYCARDYLSFSPLDHNPFAELVKVSSSLKEIKTSLQKWGITHIYVNLSEIKRVEETYRAFNWGKEDFLKFRDFLQKQCNLLFKEKGVEIFELK
ncbi:glycosyltransferase family 39 protein [Candidatus Calescamantes bacterium]|nr:glycosyltransferase family 39 protein [Candidatus Calescamantes bacterium]